MEKQAVYDKRYTLKKKLASSSVSTATTKPVSHGKKRGLKPKAKLQAVIAPALIIPKPEKAITTIHKPIELKFSSFSIKLNGMPQKISVNPETNSIEIDL